MPIDKEEPFWIGQAPDEPHSQQTFVVCASYGRTFEEKLGIDVGQDEMCCCKQCEKQYELII